LHIGVALGLLGLARTAAWTNEPLGDMPQEALAH